MHSSILFILLIICTSKLSTIATGDGDLTNSFHSNNAGIQLKPHPRLLTEQGQDEKEPLQQQVTNEPTDEKQQKEKEKKEEKGLPNSTSQQQQQQQQQQENQDESNVQPQPQPNSSEEETNQGTKKHEQENENNKDSSSSNNNNSSSSKNNNNNNKGFVSIVLPLLCIAFGLCIILKKILDRRRQYAGRWIVGSQDPDDDNDDPDGGGGGGGNVGDYENKTFNFLSLNTGMDHATKEHSWISREDDWDWEEDARAGQDLEMGRIVTSSTNLYHHLSREGSNSSSSRALSVVSTGTGSGGSSNSQNTFPTNHSSRSSTMSSVKRRSSSTCSVSIKSHDIVMSKEKEEYQGISRNQSLIGKVKANDSWDDHPSDLEEEEEQQQQQHQQQQQKQIEKEETSTYTQPPPTSVANTNQKEKSKSTTSTRTPTVEELLAEQFQNGQVPVITSLSMTKTKNKPTAPRTTTPLPSSNTDQDDIFASMGLSSIPKIKSDFQKKQQDRIVSNVKVVLPSTTTAKQNDSNPPSNGVSLITPSSLEEETDWGDDGDLDDLLLND